MAFIPSLSARRFISGFRKNTSETCDGMLLRGGMVLSVFVNTSLYGWDVDFEKSDLLLDFLLTISRAAD